MSPEQNMAESRLGFILDTDTCIYLLNNVAIVKEKAHQVGIQSIAISIITLGELFFGAYHSQKREHNIQRVKEFIAPPGPQILPVTEMVAQRFGAIKADLASSGKIIGDFDILIAATALVTDCKLVTNNQKHYQRVEGLQLQNWLT